MCNVRHDARQTFPAAVLSTAAAVAAAEIDKTQTQLDKRVASKLLVFSTQRKFSGESSSLLKVRTARRIIRNF